MKSEADKAAETAFSMFLLLLFFAALAFFGK